MVPASSVSKRGAISSMRSPTSFSVPSMRPMTSARFPPSLRSGSWLPTDQYEITFVTCSVLASCSVIAIPAACTPGSSTAGVSAPAGASGTVTRRTMLGTPVPKVSSRVSSAWNDSLPGSPKPPEESSLATPPPRLPPTANSTTAATRMKRRLATAKRAILTSMVTLPYGSMNTDNVTVLTRSPADRFVQMTSVTPPGRDRQAPARAGTRASPSSSAMFR